MMNLANRQDAVIESHKLKRLPTGWRWVKLGEVCSIINGKNQKDVVNPEGKYPIYGSSGIFGYADKYLANEGSTVVGRKGNINSPIYVETKFWNVDTAFALTPNEEINGKFLFYFCKGFNFHALDKSTTIPSLAKTDLLKIDISIPTLLEQHAIVSKIEELFSELDKGKQQLETALQQLKVYRQAVLKSAFEGRLTNRDVKEGELPEGWKSVTMRDVCIKIGDIDHKMPKQISSGYPYVSTKDFSDDLTISFQNVKHISKEDFHNLGRKIRPERGDIIFPRYGTIGKNILIDFDKEFLVSYSCAIIKPNQNLVSSKYVYLYSLSPQITKEINKYVVETTQANIGIASINSFVFPWPSIGVQNEVVREIESRLSVCNKLEETIITSLQQAETLRQSILKQAFEGKLVSTNCSN
jgi:type I restriction enzyme S subunit